MSLLLNCQSLEKSFGSQRLFKGLSMSVFAGDRLGLIGPNGAGKSTLLQILAGEEQADAGILSPKKDLRIGYVPQSNTFPDLTPLVILKSALATVLPDYEKERLAETWLTKLGFKGTETSAALLSGGWKKRLAIAKALCNQPDLLLLDEPTNHLDLEGVLWLEKFLHREAPTFIFVSHDRTFLQNMATRIIEIDRIYPEGLFSIEGSFENFLEKKRAFVEGQMEQERSMASKARRETEWLRSSPKARTTKAQSRIDNAQEVLSEHAELQKRNTLKKVDLSFEASERETRKLLVAKNLSFEVSGRTLFRHLDFTLLRGTRLGLIGPNGSGKTTLLRLLSGELNPHQGTIKRAEDLKISYFDQHRAQLPPELTLKEALSPLGDFVFFQGRPIHVNGWCKRFLFSPDALGMPIGKLSGGERARVAIAHLMLQPADLLLLDEPANDLDIATLQMLEENLLEFSGAVVLITHDRSMLEGICNLFLALGEKENGELYAAFSQWERTRENQPSTPPKSKEERKKAPTEKKKLSYKEKLEYEQIESRIAQEEEKLKSLNALTAAPEMMQDAEKLKETCLAIANCEENIHKLYERFAELDDLKKKELTSRERHFI